MKTVNFGSIVIDQRLVIYQTKEISIVANLFQTRGGIAFMAIPFDGKNLRDRSLSDRISILQKTEEAFKLLGLLGPSSELLLNQGELVGQTVQHLHIHSFIADEKDGFLLNWGRDGLPEGVSFFPFTGEVPGEEQFNLYRKGEGEWLLISRGKAPRKGDNPRRGEVFPIIVDGKLLSEWERKILLYRKRFSDSFGKI